MYRVTAGHAGAPAEFELQLTVKIPPRHIAWRTSNGTWSGTIDLESLGPERTAVSIGAESTSTAEGVSPPASAVHDGLQVLKRTLQGPHVQVTAGSSSPSSWPGSTSARRYASEWRDTAQSALTRPTEFPLRLMRTISRQMDRVWSDVLSGTAVSRLPQMVPGMPWNPNVEVCEQNDQVRVCIDVPGVEQSKLQVEIDEGSLTVRGDRQDERASEGGRRRSELHYGSFTRRIPLPDGVDADAARAVLRNGVLEIRIPMHRREPRRVPVQHA
jgi:HSP20 family protein